MKEKKILTTKEVAQLLGTPLVTVQRWVHQGKIPCKFKNNTYCFKKSEIINWAKSHDFLLVKKETKITAAPQPEAVSLKKAVERGGIIKDLEGNDIYSVLNNVVDKIKLPEGTDKELVFNELINREEIASTGIGKGVAIPHPRRTLNLNLQHPVIPVAFLKDPVDFNAVDGEEIFVLFLMFSPSTHLHLKLLSRLSLCLRSRHFLSLLKKRPDENELLAAIEKMEKEFDADKK